jgi:CDP-ribitol ribitolphosphotransferase
MPLRRRIVLATSHGWEVTGNLAWIRDDLQRRYPDVPVRTISTRPRRGVIGSLRSPAAIVRAGRELATARVVVVDDYFFPMYVITPRAGTVRIQVWHAAGAFKKFGYSVVDKGFGADEELVRRVRIHSNYSLALVSSMAVAPHYAEAFGQPLDIFTSRIGIPRADVFGNPALRGPAERRVREQYDLPEGRRVILYAPTFRGSSARRARSADVMDLAAMQRVLGADHVLLLKLHPFIRRREPLPPELAGFVIDASGDPSINELMLVSDMLVTDYSSAIYEFALLGRPILFLAPDEDAYDLERGFYFDFRTDAPGPIFDTTEELAAHIRQGGFDLDRVRAFANASFDVADGRATQRLVDRVLIPGVDGNAPTAADLEAAPGDGPGET